MQRSPHKPTLWLLAGLLALLLAALASPYYVGLRIEERLRHSAAALNDALPLQIRLLDYQRGWVESHFIAELHFPGLSTPLRASQQIAHGPLYLGALNHGERPLLAAWLESRRAPQSMRLLGLGPVPLRGRADLDGGLAASLDLPMQYAALSHRGSIRSEGLRGYYSDSQQGARGWLSLAAANWQPGQHRGRGERAGHGELRQLDLLLNRRGAASWPPPLELQLQLGELRQQTRDLQIALDDLELRASGAADGVRLNLRVELIASRLAFGDRSIREPHLQLVLRKLPPELWGWLGGGALRRLGSGELGAEGFAVELLRQLPAEVELEVARAVLSVDRLPFEGWMRASLCAPPPEGGGERLSDWLPALCLRGELAAEEGPLIALLERETGLAMRGDTFGVVAELSAEEAEALVRPSVQAQLAVLSSQGYVDYRNGRYHVEVSLRGGILSLGGQSVEGLSFVR